MEKSQVVQRLNWFYSLELNQVNLYLSQSKKVDELYIKKALEHMAQIEDQHASNIKAVLKELGAKPLFLGDLIGSMAGQIGGQIISLVGLKNMFKANVLLEQKAMADYKRFIADLKKDKALIELLWTHLIEEDLHASWFANKARELDEKQHA